MFRKILIPVDLTDKNRRAVEAARDLALWRPAEIAILHVIELLDAPMEELADFYQQLEETARRRMEAFAEPLRAAGLAFTQHLRYGKRVPEILRFVREEGFDMMVLASRTLDPERPEGTWLTISHQLVMLADCTVLVLKHRSDAHTPP